MIMTSTLKLGATLLATLAIVSPAAAQQATADAAAPSDAASQPAAAATDSSWKDGKPISIQYLRPQDQRGLNVFETSKNPGVAFEGFKIDFGAAFTSQVQDLTHRNAALPNVVGGVNANQLADIGFGFNNPTANLNVNVQLAPGIRVALTSYLSSRHHNETWVKDGYLQIDESPIDVPALNALMKVMTVRVGDMEINYGDAHFRRSDNGNAIFNPFVGNYIMDAFTTQIGGEVYLKARNVIAMGSVTGGELRGTVLTPGARGPSYVGKLGYDRQVRPNLRVRLTGSTYIANRAMSDTLYSGDRAGSRFYYVLENTQATESAQKDSGLLNPGFKNEVHAYQVNPFVKFQGLELFGVVERATGRAASEASDRTWKQYAADAIYRFAPKERLFVGARYNKAFGPLPTGPGNVGARRWEAGGGWFITPNVMAKGEYVRQDYFGYPTTDIKSGGRFNGMMLEGVVAF
jgi:hypothetical protein